MRYDDQEEPWQDHAPIALPICLWGPMSGRPNYCTIAWFTMIDDEPPR